MTITIPISSKAVSLPLLLVLLAFVPTSHCVDTEGEPATTDTEPKPDETAEYAEVTELQIVETFVPDKCETKTKAGDYVRMHYIGKIADQSPVGEKGFQFDASYGREPFAFQLGAGQVIKGWDEGLTEMCKGETRTLIIPHHLAYGETGHPQAGIPGGSTLRFDVELLEILDSPPEAPDIFGEIDADGNYEITKEELDLWFKTVREMDATPEGIFEQEDANGDGVISHEEFSGPKRPKEEADKDEL